MGLSKVSVVIPRVLQKHLMSAAVASLLQVFPNNGHLQILLNPKSQTLNLPKCQVLINCGWNKDLSDVAAWDMTRCHTYNIPNIGMEIIGCKTNVSTKTTVRGEEKGFGPQTRFGS
jgi:hypothetical protein